jgi:hypothetical protein
MEIKVWDKDLKLIANNQKMGGAAIQRLKSPSLANVSICKVLCTR